MGLTENESKIYKDLASKVFNGIIVEVGSFEGTSLSYIKDTIHTNNNKCWSVEIRPIEKLIENTSKWGINLFKGASVDASKTFDDFSLDLVFIDACHKYECVYKDITHWLPKMKNNGILCGHDFCDHFSGVKKAVIKLLPNYFVFHNSNIWAYKKGIIKMI